MVSVCSEVIEIFKTHTLTYIFYSASSLQFMNSNPFSLLNSYAHCFDAIKLWETGK